MHQRTRPVRLVSLVLGLAVTLVGVAPVTTSVTRAQEPQEPRTYLYEYRGPLPAASVQSLGERYLDVASGAVTPVSGTIEILIEELEQDLEETEQVETILYRFEARVEVFGELNTLLSPGSMAPAGGEMTRSCALGHWRWVAEYVADQSLIDDGQGTQLDMGGTATDFGVGPDCTGFVPLEGGSGVYFKLFRGDVEDSWLVCAFHTYELRDDGALHIRDVWTREECLASAVELPLQS